MSTSMRTIMNEIVLERYAQDEKWGEQNHPFNSNDHQVWFSALASVSKKANDDSARLGNLTWADILLEEVYEAIAEKDPKKIREELIQVAAVAAAAIECLDRHEP